MHLLPRTHSVRTAVQSSPSLPLCRAQVLWAPGPQPRCAAPHPGKCRACSGGVRSTLCSCQPGPHLSLSQSPNSVGTRPRDRQTEGAWGSPRACMCVPAPSVGRQGWVTLLRSLLAPPGLWYGTFSVDRPSGHPPVLHICYDCTEKPIPGHRASGLSRDRPNHGPPRGPPCPAHSALQSALQRYHTAIWAASTLDPQHIHPWPAASLCPHAPFREPLAC